MKETPKVYKSVMIDKGKLKVHPKNSNKQSKKAFKELRKSIRENGFDETLLVSPIEGTDKFEIIAGNHRFKAGVEEGMEEFPCVVRDDWDEVHRQVEIFRRNYHRGDISKEAFTLAVDSLLSEAAIDVEEVQDLMGFSSEDEFYKLYSDPEDLLLVEAARKDISNSSRPAGNTANQVKMLDNMSLILSGIYEKYGETASHSFIVFPASGKKHLFVAANQDLVENLSRIAEYSIAKNIDINVVLSGILKTGLDNSSLVDFKETNPFVDEILDDSKEVSYSGQSED